MPNFNAILGKLTQDENLDLFELLWTDYLTDDQKAGFISQYTSELRDLLPGED